MRSSRPKPLDSEKLMTYALRCLSGRAYSSGELREKLRRRAESPTSVDAIVGKLKDTGYLNDQRFAENFAAARLENEGFGRMRVLRDLRQRRVAPKVAEQVVDATFRETEETQLIQAFLQRKYRTRPLPEFLSVDKNLAAAFRRLRYAGFSAGNSIRVLKQYSRNEEALDILESSDEAESPVVPE